MFLQSAKQCVSQCCLLRQQTEGPASRIRSEGSVSHRPEPIVKDLFTFRSIELVRRWQSSQRRRQSSHDVSLDIHCAYDNLGKATRVGIHGQRIAASRDLSLQSVQNTFLRCVDPRTRLLSAKRSQRCHSKPPVLHSCFLCVYGESVEYTVVLESKIEGNVLQRQYKDRNRSHDGRRVLCGVPCFPDVLSCLFLS